MNQNLTLLFVLRSTLKIMIEAKRCSKTAEKPLARTIGSHTSYNRPDATVNILMSA